MGEKHFTGCQICGFDRYLTTGRTRTKEADQDSPCGPDGVFSCTRSVRRLDNVVGPCTYERGVHTVYLGERHAQVAVGTEFILCLRLLECHFQIALQLFSAECRYWCLLTARLEQLCLPTVAFGCIFPIQACGTRFISPIFSFMSGSSPIRCLSMQGMIFSWLFSQFAVLTFCSVFRFKLFHMP